MICLTLKISHEAANFMETKTENTQKADGQPRCAVAPGSALMSFHDECEAMALMVDIFCACIETKTLPAFGSECHRKARNLVAISGYNFKRRRKRLPTLPNVIDLPRACPARNVRKHDP